VPCYKGSVRAISAAGFAVVCALSAHAQVAPKSQPAKWNRIETIRDRDDKSGSVERTICFESEDTSTSEEPVTRIRILTPGQPAFVLKNEFSWWIKLSDGLPGGFLAKTKNALASKYVFGLRTSISQIPHTFLFLVGWPFGSSPGSLHVLDLEATNPPAVVLRKEELELVGFRDLDGDGVPEIIGAPCMSQEFGDHLLTYDPLHVYAIKARGRTELSIPLSRAYNEEHYYGWVGPVCSEDWAVVLHPPGGGKPTIMKTAEAEKLQGNPLKK